MRASPPPHPTAVCLATLALLLGAAGLTGAAPLAAASAGHTAAYARASAAKHPNPDAHAARSVYLREVGHLRYLRGNESTLDERGSASGTFRGTVTAQLKISAEHVSAVFTMYPKGGSVTGRAWARFIIKGHTGYYGGTLNIVHGTGIYRHASGKRIGISGTIDRYSFALLVKANGWIRY